MAATNAYALWVAQATAGEGVTPFDNANAHLGVGDGTTAFSPTQTDLQGTNKIRKPMDPGYPVRTGTKLTFRATFGSNEANFAWNEWGVFNAASGGVMLNRLVSSMGTKASGATWVFEVEINISAA